MNKKTNKVLLRRWVIPAVCFGLFMFVSPMISVSETPVLTGVVNTSSGPVQGLVINDIHTFKGIRYGAPPTGKNRFLPPQKPKPTTGRIDATHYGAPAMQMAAGSTAEPTSDFGMLMRSVFPTPSELKIDNEDCLFLNIWTPATGDNKSRPVMVWFHGGGFAYGSGAWPIYHGENLSQRGDVVVVTVNHRLNVFGYLYLAELLGTEYESSGNAGMLDLVLSLEWIRDNITAFGGNPGNVTIMGESGGGMKVSLLMAMPKAKGLFHKAIIQSGPGLTAIPADIATKNAKVVLTHLGINDPKKDLTRLLSVTAEELLAAAGNTGEMGFEPVVDGKILPRNPFVPEAPEISADIPVLIGFNKDEMTIFQITEPWFGSLTEEQLQKQTAAIPKGAELIEAFRKIHPDYSPTYLFTAISSTWATYDSYELADRKAAQKKAPVFMYELAWETPINNGLLRTPHTLEIAFMFDNVDKSLPLVGSGTEPQQLANQMSSAWIAFAKTGNPNTKEIPRWPTYDTTDRATMVFNLESKVINDPYSTIRAILSKK